MKTTPVTESIFEYMCHIAGAEPAVLSAIRHEAAAAGLPAIHISQEQVAVLQLLVRISGAKNILEIGSLGGYSAVAMAMALPPGEGGIVTLELEEARAAMTRKNAEAAGYGAAVSVRQGAALETLKTFPAEPCFDLVFIDADKGGYVDYLNASLPLLRSGGMVIADNTLAWGEVADVHTDRPVVQAIQRYNEVVRTHPQLEYRAIIPVGDGMTIAIKRS